MCRQRLARPNRANFLGGIVANRKDRIQLWRAGLSKFIPTLAAQPGGGKTSRLQQPGSVRIDAAARVAAGAVSREVGLAFLVQDGLAMRERKELPVHRKRTL
jgi:hypothetical protein